MNSSYTLFPELYDKTEKKSCASNYLFEGKNLNVMNSNLYKNYREIQNTDSYNNNSTQNTLNSIEYLDSYLKKFNFSNSKDDKKFENYNFSINKNINFTNSIDSKKTMISSNHENVMNSNIYIKGTKTNKIEVSGFNPLSIYYILNCFEKFGKIVNYEHITNTDYLIIEYESYVWANDAFFYYNNTDSHNYFIVKLKSDTFECKKNKDVISNKKNIYVLDNNVLLPKKSYLNKILSYILPI